MPFRRFHRIKPIEMPSSAETVQANGLPVSSRLVTASTVLSVGGISDGGGQ